MAACLTRNRKTHMLFSADDDVMQCEQARSSLRIPQYDYNIIKSMIVSENSITSQEYDECLKMIDETKLRGKWELKFVIWFLEGLRKQIKNGESGLSKNNRNVISFQNEIMTSMEKYAVTTESLIHYITRSVI